MTNLKNTTIPESPEVMSMENTNPLQGGTPLSPINSEPWKRVLMANGISITSSLIPILYESLKNDPTMQKKKLTKEQLIDLMWYNIPPVVSVVRKLTSGTKMEQFVAKAELVAKAAPLVPVVQAIMKNKDKHGLEKVDLNVVIKTIPFLSNIITPYVVKDPKAIIGIFHLSTVLLPMGLGLFATFGGNSKLKRYANSIPGFFEIFRQMGGIFSKYFSKNDPGSQYASIFGTQARMNGGIFGNQNTNMLSDISRVMNTIGRVGHMVQHGGNSNYIGNGYGSPNDMLYAGNSVNNGQNNNLYFNRQSGAVI